MLFNDSFLTLLQREHATSPQLQSPSVTPEQQILENANKKIESLELELSESIGIMQTTRYELYNCQIAHEMENNACTNAVRQAYRSHQDCYLAYLDLRQRCQSLMKDYDDLFTLNMQLQDTLAGGHDSNQNIEIKMGWTSPNEQGLAEAGVQSGDVKLVKAEINMVQVDKKIGKPSANICTGMLHEHTQKKRLGDDEGLAFEKEKKETKKPRRNRVLKSKVAST